MFFVYVDFVDDGRPFYVGKGNLRRVNALARNRYHSNVARKHGCTRVVVLETPFEFEALNREIRLIAELHTFVDDPQWNGVGTNFTMGGEGLSGSTRSPAVRAKIAASNKGLKRDAGFIERNRAAQRIAQNQPDVAFRRKTMLASPTIKKAIGDANKARWVKRRAACVCSRCGLQGHFRVGCTVRLTQRNQLDSVDIIIRIERRNADRGCIDLVSDKIVMLNLTGAVLTTFKTYVEASRVTSINCSNICQCVKGHKKHMTAGGFVWRVR